MQSYKFGLLSCSCRLAVEVVTRSLEKFLFLSFCKSAWLSRDAVLLYRCGAGFAYPAAEQALYTRWEIHLNLNPNPNAFIDTERVEYFPPKCQCRSRRPMSLLICNWIEFRPLICRVESLFPVFCASYLCALNDKHGRSWRSSRRKSRSGWCRSSVPEAVPGLFGGVSFVEFSVLS